MANTHAVTNSLVGGLPPDSSTCAMSDRSFHCTAPVSKVWLLALTEMLSTFRPTDPHSHFQEIQAEDEPSFRAKYTYKVRGGEKESSEIIK